MVRLVELSPCAGLLPVTIGSLTLTEVDPGPAHALAPYAGKTDAVERLLKSTLGIGFPPPNQSEISGSVRLLWAGRGRALLLGAPVPEGVAALAAVTDQSDASAVVEVAGPAAEAVLARLVPIDLRARVFAEGQTARTLVGHMTAQVTRTGAARFEIMAFRSMAATLVHELTQAARGVAARG